MLENFKIIILLGAVTTAPNVIHISLPKANGEGLEMTCLTERFNPAGNGRIFLFIHQ